VTPETTTDERFLARAARWASSLICDDIPPEVREAALTQRASTLGAALWTTTHPVGDHSVIPNGLGGPNPTHTGQALALRTAERYL